MKIIKPSVEILTQINGEEILKQIEQASRTCYKSEDRITNDSARKLVTDLIKRDHLAMIEHVSLTAKFICDRGCSHEIVRHRIASYAQESTRYVNYSQGKFGNEITVIEPLFYDKNSDAYKTWQSSCEFAERSYLLLLELGSTPQEARSVLPNSLKTEIVVTMNLREFRHFFKLRTAKTAHPQMREVAIPLLYEMKQLVPIIFDDIEVFD